MSQLTFYSGQDVYRYKTLMNTFVVKLISIDRNMFLANPGNCVVLQLAYTRNSEGFNWQILAIVMQLANPGNNVAACQFTFSGGIIHGTETVSGQHLVCNHVPGCIVWVIHIVLRKVELMLTLMYMYDIFLGKNMKDVGLRKSQADLVHVILNE